MFLKNMCQLTYDDNSKFIYAVLYVMMDMYMYDDGLIIEYWPYVCF